jgi:hypothetical protein
MIMVPNTRETGIADVETSTTLTAPAAAILYRIQR